FFFCFNDPAPTELYTLSLHERSSDLPCGYVAASDSLISRAVSAASSWRYEINIRVFTGIGGAQIAIWQRRTGGRHATENYFRALDPERTHLNSTHSPITSAGCFFARK